MYIVIICFKKTYTGLNLLRLIGARKLKTTLRHRRPVEGEIVLVVEFDVDQDELGKLSSSDHDVLVVDEHKAAVHDEPIMQTIFCNLCKKLFVKSIVTSLF